MEYQYHLAFRLIPFARRGELISLRIQALRLGKQELVKRLDRFKVDGAVHMATGVLVIEATIDNMVPSDLVIVFALQQVAQLPVSNIPYLKERHRKNIRCWA